MVVAAMVSDWSRRAAASHQDHCQVGPAVAHLETFRPPWLRNNLEQPQTTLKKGIQGIFALPAITSAHRDRSAASTQILHTNRKSRNGNRSLGLPLRQSFLPPLKALCTIQQLRTALHHRHRDSGDSTRACEERQLCSGVACCPVQPN